MAFSKFPFLLLFFFSMKYEAKLSTEITDEGLGSDLVRVGDMK